MCPQFGQFYKKVILRLDEHFDVIETQTIRFVPLKIFQQTRSLIATADYRLTALVLNPLTLARATIVPRTFLVITRQLLQLERCSNPLRIQQV